MKHLGDITKINGATVPPVNVVIGGSPCQDLSVAGKRAGLAGEHSGLFIEQLRIIKEMRKADADRGRTGKDIRPRFMVWENVPGAFSSNKGADFGAVLQETIRVVCEEVPVVPMPKNGWPTAGCLTNVGGQWSVAWRVFDAQFWGVPQRRRRIALVADFGGLTAPEILFEREGVSGYYPQGRTPWERAAADTQRGVGETGFGDLMAQTLKICGGCEGGGKGALIQTDKSATLACNNDQTLFQPTYCIQGNCIDRADTAGCNGKGWTENVSYTLNTVDRPATVYCIGNGQADQTGLHTKAGTLNCMHDQQALLFENHSQDSRYKGPLDVCPPLPAQMGTGGNNTPLVRSEAGETVYSLDRASFNQGANAQYNFDISDKGINSTLTAKGPSAVAAVDCRNATENANTNGTLQAKESGGTSYNLNNVVRNCYTVRRLTPLECERLQGFPDGWTQIGELVDVLTYTDEDTGCEYKEGVYQYTDSDGKTRKTTDSNRYKALGNSIAIPPWFYVLAKLSLCCGADVTMASLFDGIGGFPLIWETINGEGQCLWASEIENFPIAVTQLHFPDKE